MLSYECTAKINEVKGKLRAEFQNYIIENEQLKIKIKAVEEENVTLTNKFERAEKYGIEVEEISTQIK